MNAPFLIPAKISPIFSKLAPDSDHETKPLEATAWIYETACGLVDDASKVFITVTVTDSVSTFSVRVAPGDVGKLIGKQGRNARALRTLFQAIGRRLGLVFVLDIEEMEEANGEVQS